MSLTPGLFHSVSFASETFPDGLVTSGSVTATWPDAKRPVPFDLGGRNWVAQGADDE